MRNLSLFPTFLKKGQVWEAKKCLEKKSLEASGSPVKQHKTPGYFFFFITLKPRVE